MRRLCRYACRPEGCYQRNLFHLERFAHPGDEEWLVLISSDDEAFGEPALGSPAGSSPTLSLINQVSGRALDQGLGRWANTLAA